MDVSMNKMYDALGTEGPNTQAQPQQPSPSPQPQQQQTTQGSNSPTTSTDEEPKLERSDSYDSLSSFIVAKRNAASGGGSAASSTKASPVQPKRGETWGSYLTGWAWSSNTETAASKNDDKSTKTE